MPCAEARRGLRGDTDEPAFGQQQPHVFALGAVGAAPGGRQVDAGLPQHPVRRPEAAIHPAEHERRRVADTLVGGEVSEKRGHQESRLRSATLIGLPPGLRGLPGRPPLITAVFASRSARACFLGLQFGNTVPQRADEGAQFIELHGCLP